MRAPPGYLCPEAYLFTVATNLVYERTVRQAAAPLIIELEEGIDELETAEESTVNRVAIQRRFEKLERAVARLSPRMRTTLLMHRRDGFSLD